MNAKVEKRRDFLINLLFLGAILALMYVFFKYLFWLVAPFLISFFFAMVLQRPLRWLDKKTNKKAHTLWVFVLIILMLAIIIGPISLILSSVINRISEFVAYITTQLNDLPAFLATLENQILDIIKFLPDKLYNIASENITNVFSDWIEGSGKANFAIDMDTVKTGITTGVNGVYSVVKSIPSILISIVIGAVALVLFTKDYDFIVGFIKKQLPSDKKNALSDMKKVFSKTIVTMFKAYGLIMCVTFIELFLGLSIMSMLGILNNNFYILIALGTAIFDIMPVAGSGGVLIPWAFIALVTGNYKLAIGIIVLYACITVIRQYIEPKIVGSSLGVHPIVTLMGLYIGLKLFGFIGMLIVPLTIMTLKALNDSGRINLWKPVEAPISKKAKKVK